MKRPTNLLIAILPLVLAACGGTKTADMRDAWQDQRIDSYAFTLARICFCPGPHEVRITVEEDEITKVIDTQTGAEVDRTSVEWPTIDGIFKIILDAEANRADKVEVTYDDTYLHPVTVNIDYIEEAVDDELGLLVSSFTPKTIGAAP
jgi:hypothetical protein